MDRIDRQCYALLSKALAIHTNEHGEIETEAAITHLKISLGIAVPLAYVQASAAGSSHEIENETTNSQVQDASTRNVHFERRNSWADMSDDWNSWISLHGRTTIFLPLKKIAGYSQNWKRKHEYSREWFYQNIRRYFWSDERVHGSGESVERGS